MTDLDTFLMGALVIAGDGVRHAAAGEVALRRLVEGLLADGPFEAVVKVHPDTQKDVVYRSGEVIGLTRSQRIDLLVLLNTAGDVEIFDFADVVGISLP